MSEHKDSPDLGRLFDRLPGRNMSGCFRQRMVAILATDESSRRSRSRITHYGWWIAVITGFIAMLAVGLGHTLGTSDLAAKGNTPHGVFTQMQAVAKVNPLLGTTFPKKPETVHGRIGVGGPYPMRTIPAILSTGVQETGAMFYLITFSEQWSAKDFNSTGHPTNANLEHYWTFRVTPSGSQLVRQGGDLPPQEAR